jgi:hypothetical protein
VQKVLVRETSKHCLKPLKESKKGEVIYKEFSGFNKYSWKKCAYAFDFQLKRIFLHNHSL